MRSELGMLVAAECTGIGLHTAAADVRIVALWSTQVVVQYAELEALGIDQEHIAVQYIVGEEAVAMGHTEAAGEKIAAVGVRIEGRLGNEEVDLVVAPDSEQHGLAVAPGSNLAGP
jgi:hypothetical protein